MTAKKNNSSTEGGMRQAVDGRRSVEPIDEWRLVGKDPTERHVAGDRCTLEDGGRPLAPKDEPMTPPLLPPMTIPLSERRRPANDCATRR